METGQSEEILQFTLLQINQRVEDRAKYDIAQLFNNHQKFYFELDKNQH